MSYLKKIKLKKVKRRPMKGRGKRDSEGRYNFSQGGSANLVASAMEVQKPN